MTDNFTGPDLFEQSMAALRDVIDPPSEDQDDDRLSRIAQAYATNAQTAAIVMFAGLYADARGMRSRELEVWTEVIPSPPLVECWGKETRRPACEERHTEDCAYADPPPEPKHELLPVGTYVLVSERETDREGWTRYKNPVAGKITGYDMGKTKYRWVAKSPFGVGGFYSHEQWAFVDNRVQVHPDGPECPEVTQ